MRNNILLKLILILLCISCKSQKNQSNKDTQEIVNVLLKDYDSVSLIRETYYDDNSFNPIKVLNPYYRIYNYDIMKKNESEKENNVAYTVFLKDVDGLISKSELDEMKEKYKSWSIKKWEDSDIKNSKVNLISLQERKNKNDTIPILMFSEPLYTKNKKKAIIHTTYVKNNTGASGIQIMIKENGRWVKKGGIPNGTIG